MLQGSKVNTNKFSQDEGNQNGKQDDEGTLGVAAAFFCFIPDYRYNPHKSLCIENSLMLAYL